MVRVSVRGSQATSKEYVGVVARCSYSLLASQLGSERKLRRNPARYLHLPLQVMSDGKINGIEGRPPRHGPPTQTRPLMLVRCSGQGL